MDFPITVNLYRGGQYNVPDFSDVVNISKGISSYSHSISARGGCESANIQIEIPVEYGVQYLNYILHHVRVYDSYAQQVWCGYVDSITIDFGSSTTSIGVKDFASRFVLFVNGNVSGTIYDDNVASVYGDKISYIRVDAGVLSATQVTQNLTRALALMGSPKIDTRTTSETKSRQTCTVTINCAGYYTIAEWQSVGASQLIGTNTDNADAIITRMNAVLAVNNWFDIGNCLALTGITDATSNRWDAYATYDQVLNDLFESGTIDGNILSYGVQPNGLFTFDISQINGENISYYKSLASSKIFDVNGAEIPPTQVLPDKNISITELRPQFVRYSRQYIGLQFIDRVALKIDRNGYTLTLEPSTLNDATYDLARLVKKAKKRRNNR